MSGRQFRGMTLLEVLVTLLIVGMVAGLAAQGLQQLARVERMLEEVGAEGQQRMLRREWLRGLIAAALPEQINTPLQFAGDAAGFRLSSALALELPLGGVGSGAGPAASTGSVRIELRSEPDGLQQLRLRGLSESGVGEQSGLALLSWRGEAGRIHYQDHQGVWHERWPVNVDAMRRPPAMVRLDLGAEAGGVLLAPVAGREPPRARLSDWTDG